MDKKAKLKSMISRERKSPGGYTEMSTDSPWWSRYANSMGEMGKTPKERAKSRQQRVMEAMDINHEYQSRSSDRDLLEGDKKFKRSRNIT